MTHPLTIPALGLLISMTALPALPDRSPKPGSHDARVTYATYQEGQVYRINTRLRNVTLVELGIGEQIQSIAIGDLESFKIDKLERANLFIIMPAFAPVSISDDGRKTTFVIPPGAPMPTIFRADAKGQEYSVNSSVRGTTITVSTRSERWVLRYGEEYVCVTAEAGINQ